MKRWMKRLGVVLSVLVAAWFAFSLYYFMPRATKVTISGTDVKRVERKNPQPGQGPTRDVRYVYATAVDTGKALAFRNEDNGWYFKWDSGDIAAQAMSLAQSETASKADKGPNTVVLVKYYGVRFPFVSAYPNILSLRQVPANYVYIPVVPIIILLVLLILFVWGGIKLRKLFRAAGRKARELAGRGGEPA